MFSILYTTLMLVAWRAQSEPSLIFIAAGAIIRDYGSWLGSNLVPKLSISIAPVCRNNSWYIYHQSSTFFLGKSIDNHRAINAEVTLLAQSKAYDGWTLCDSMRERRERWLNTTPRTCAEQWHYHLFQAVRQCVKARQCQGLSINDNISKFFSLRYTISFIIFVSKTLAKRLTI